jgi:hypothetical protein
MPFGGWFDSYYEDIYCPAIAAARMTSRRVDDLYRPSNIIQDVWGLTQTAKVILADLTGKNPNVFYELGLAHAIAQPVVLVAEALDDVPYDLRGLRVIIYDKNQPDWGNVLKQAITTSLGEVLSSPEAAVPPTFLKVKTSHAGKSVTAQERRILELRRDVEVLRREVQSGPSPTSGASTGILRGPDEALARMHQLVERRVPDRAIRQELVSQGAPPDWVDDKLRMLRNERLSLRGRKSKSKGIPLA